MILAVLLSAVLGSSALIKAEPDPTANFTTERQWLVYGCMENSRGVPNEKLKRVRCEAQIDQVAR